MIRSILLLLLVASTVSAEDQHTSGDAKGGSQQGETIRRDDRKTIYLRILQNKTVSEEDYDLYLRAKAFGLIDRVAPEHLNDGTPELVYDELREWSLDTKELAQDPNAYKDRFMRDLVRYNMQYPPQLRPPTLLAKGSALWEAMAESIHSEPMGFYTDDLLGSFGLHVNGYKPFTVLRRNARSQAQLNAFLDHKLFRQNVNQSLASLLEIYFKLPEGKAKEELGQTLWAKLGARPEEDIGHVLTQPNNRPHVPIDVKLQYPGYFKVNAETGKVELTPEELQKVRENAAKEALAAFQKQLAIQQDKFKPVNERRKAAKEAQYYAGLFIDLAEAFIPDARDSLRGGEAFLELSFALNDLVEINNELAKLPANEIDTASEALGQSSSEWTLAVAALRFALTLVELSAEQPPTFQEEAYALMGELIDVVDRIIDKSDTRFRKIHQDLREVRTLMDVGFEEIDRNNLHMAKLAQRIARALHEIELTPPTRKQHLRAMVRDIYETSHTQDLMNECVRTDLTDTTELVHSLGRLYSCALDASSDNLAAGDLLKEDLQAGWNQIHQKLVSTWKERDYQTSDVMGMIGDSLRYAGFSRVDADMPNPLKWKACSEAFMGVLLHHWPQIQKAAKNPDYREVIGQNIERLYEVGAKYQEMAVAVSQSPAFRKPDESQHDYLNRTPTPGMGTLFSNYRNALQSFREALGNAADQFQQNEMAGYPLFQKAPSEALRPKRTDQSMRFGHSIQLCDGKGPGLKVPDKIEDYFEDIHLTAHDLSDPINRYLEELKEKARIDEMGFGRMWKDPVNKKLKRIPNIRLCYRAEEGENKTFYTPHPLRKRDGEKDGYLYHTWRVDRVVKPKVTFVAELVFDDEGEDKVKIFEREMVSPDWIIQDRKWKSLWTWVNRDVDENEFDVSKYRIDSFECHARPILDPGSVPRPAWISPQDWANLEERPDEDGELKNDRTITAGHIDDLSPAQAFQQVWNPGADQKGHTALLRMINELAEEDPAYDLYQQFNESVAVKSDPQFSPQKSVERSEEVVHAVYEIQRERLISYLNMEMQRHGEDRAIRNAVDELNGSALVLRFALTLLAPDDEAALEWAELFGDEKNPALIMDSYSVLAEILEKSTPESKSENEGEEQAEEPYRPLNYAYGPVFEDRTDRAEQIVNGLLERGASPARTEILPTLQRLNFARALFGAPPE